MGTKNNPGKFDCYAAAHPDEPLFTLLARDPSAPHLVRLWACVRMGDIFGTIPAFAALVASMSSRLINYGSPQHDRDCRKAQEANECADAMEAWEGADVPPQAMLDFETQSTAPLITRTPALSVRVDLEPCAYPQCECDFDAICHAAIIDGPPLLGRSSRV